MKKIMIIIFLVQINHLHLFAQCPEYPRLIREANVLLKKEEYISAINKLNTAREYCPSNSKKIDIEIEKVVAAIEKKKKEADENAQKTEIILKQMKENSNKVINLLLPEIDKHILSHEYEIALNKCQLAIYLNEQKDEVNKRVQEIFLGKLK